MIINNIGTVYCVHILWLLLLFIRIIEHIADKKPNALLITSSANGKEIAARVAVKTNSGIITDAVGVDKDLITTQSVFGGSTTVHSAVTAGVPIITLRANSIEPITATSNPAVEEFAVNISDSAKLATITSATAHRLVHGRSNLKIHRVLPYEYS